MISLLIVLLLQPILLNSDIATPINSFGLELLKHVPADKNVMISPFSICTAVAMLNAGASGVTKQQIDSAFGWSGSTDISAQYKNLLTKIDESGENINKFNLNSNNRLYIDNTFTPLQSYSTELTTNFNADVEAVNFSAGDNSATVELMNSWVEDKTNGKIKDMFSSIENSVRAILINTIYFKAVWSKPFTDVSEEVFYLDEKYAVKTDTMHLEEWLPYFGNTDVELVKLPYDGARISMIVIKPKTRAGLSNLEKKIEYKFSEVASWMENVEYKLLKLSMPKFEFESGVTKLKETLQNNFGVSDVFDASKADLSGISTTEDLFVSFIIHKSFISVDENGTEAAAATAIGISLMSFKLDEPQPQEVLINQPFMFLIYDEDNKVVLFAGRMVVPDESVMSYKYLESRYVSSGAVSGIVQYRALIMWIVMVTCFTF